MNNKNVFAANLNMYMNEFGKSRKEVAQALGVSYYTFSDWVKGKKYPRMDKVEMLANYFGILKSDLIESKEEVQKKNDALSDIVIRMRTDSSFFELVKHLNELDPDKLSGLLALLK